MRKVKENSLALEFNNFEFQNLINNAHLNPEHYYKATHTRIDTGLCPYCKEWNVDILEHHFSTSCSLLHLICVITLTHTSTLNH